MHLIFGTWSTFFNLDHEYNLPTIYQGIKALGIGYFLLRSKKFKALGAMTIYAGLDETLVIHERTEEFFRMLAPSSTGAFLTTVQSMGYQFATWVILLLPVLVLISIYLVKLIIKISVKEKWILALSIGFFAISLATELISTQSGIPLWAYHTLVAIEEGCELGGITNLARLRM